MNGGTTRECSKINKECTQLGTQVLIGWEHLSCDWNLNRLHTLQCLFSGVESVAWKIACGGKGVSVCVTCEQYIDLSEIRSDILTVYKTFYKM